MIRDEAEEIIAVNEDRLGRSESLGARFVRLAANDGCQSKHLTRLNNSQD